MRDRAIKLLSKQKLLDCKAVHRDISSSCRDQFDVHGALISRTFQIGVAEKTLTELDRQDSMLKLIDDDSGAALNRARHHQ